MKFQTKTLRFGDSWILLLKVILDWEEGMDWSRMGEGEDDCSTNEGASVEVQPINMNKKIQRQHFIGLLVIDSQS